jgi:NAD(P)-dependent dehydrogenase (short-subunit alcohol dehydrogenase family)
VIAAGLDVAKVSGELRSVAEPIETDVSSASSVDDLFAHCDSLDVLVNCAGIIERGAEYDPKVFEHVVDVNLVGTMRCCLAARPLLKKTKGCIVNVASMLSFFGAPHAPAYGASKAGVAQLTKSLAMAYAVDEIRVNAIAPGWIRTELTAAVQEDPESSRRILERTPLGRWGAPDDVTGAIAFLASRQARFITGAMLHVDGGYAAS